MFRAHISKKLFKKPAKYSSKYLSLISEENKINTSFAKEIGIEYESDLCSNEIGIDRSSFFLSFLRPTNGSKVSFSFKPEVSKT